MFIKVKNLGHVCMQIYPSQRKILAPYFHISILPVTEKVELSMLLSNITKI